MNVAEQVERAWLGLRAPTPVAIATDITESHQAPWDGPILKRVESCKGRWPFLVDSAYLRMSDGSRVIVRRKPGSP